jgi:hypothetical protein
VIVNDGFESTIIGRKLRQDKGFVRKRREAAAQLQAYLNGYKILHIFLNRTLSGILRIIIAYLYPKRYIMEDIH